MVIVKDKHLFLFFFSFWNNMNWWTQKPEMYIKQALRSDFNQPRLISLILINPGSCMWQHFCKMKCNVQWVMLWLVFFWNTNMNLATFYCFGCCMYHGSSEMKCLCSIPFENNTPTTLNLTHGVKESKCEIKYICLT